MAVTKINGFRAPYRSLTFREIADSQTQRNGVVTMDGEVTQVLLSITVPAFTFIQQGMLVKKTTATVVSAPSMDAPFFLVVSAPTSNPVDDLIFSFAKSPTDVAVNEAIIAAWDGEEWRALPFLSFDGVYDDVNQANIDFDRVGPFSGVTTSVDGLDYKNIAGTVVDKQGLRQTMVEEVLFPIPLDDPDWPRVDRIIYRRPDDSENRIGVRHFYIGGTYDAAPATLYDTQAFTSALVRRNTKVVVGSDNAAHMFVATGYGGNFIIQYKKVASDRVAVLVATTTIQTGVGSTDFDVAIDKNDNLYLVFISGTDVKWRKFSSAGVALTAALTIDAQSGQCAAPRIAVDPAASKTYVVYQALVTVSQNQIFLVTTDTGGTIATPSQNINTNGFDLVAPSVFVTDDFQIYVAWENLTNTRVAYRVYNDIGTPLASETTVSSATAQIGFGTLVDAAKTPKIWVTDNKNVVVAFRQDKGGALYGLSIWTEGSAFMQELLAPAENFDRFDIFVDPIFNNYHLTVSRSTSVDFVKLREQTVDFTLALAATGTSGLSTTRDVLGSMLTLWSSPTTVSFTSYAAGISILYIGLTTVVGGLNTFNLGADEFLMGTGAAPAAGDQVVVTGSGVGNNGTYAILASTLVSLNAPNDRYRVQVSPAFTAAENPAPAVFGDFQAPDGNESRYIKNTAEKQAHAFTFDELDTDLLLARIVTPGPVILNYPSGSGGPGGGSSGMDFLLPYGASVQIDWESTTPAELTISGGLKIVDLLNNFTYSLVDGGFPMVEDDALYVVLDGANFTPTPQVTSIATLPFASPIQVLGVIKDGEFNPHLLGRGGMEQLDSGEAVIFGEQLADLQRTRLGILTETTYQAYSSIIGIGGAGVPLPTAISETNIMAGQNKHVRLVRGQWSWVKPTASELVVLTESFLQVPGAAEARNRIAPQTIMLTADGQVAYVDINRLPGVAADLVVSVSTIATLSLTRNTIILARRIAGNVILEANGGTVLNPDSTIDIGQSITEENQELLGLTATSKNGGVFTTALGPSTDNKVVANGDTFEEAIKKLDGRDDTVRKVRLIDLVSTVLPVGVSATIDGVLVANGDKVLFPNLTVNPGAYVVSGVGVALVWTQLYEFGNSLSPAARSMVAVKEGTNYLRTIWQYDTANGWKPVELASLIKEPTGFPNRTDSLIDFVDGTLTFTISVAGDHFDYFIKGKAYRKNTAQNVIIADTEGIHYIYFDGEVLSETTIFTTDLLKEYAYVAAIYWDATNNVGIVVGDERHNLVMDADTHRYLHLNYGTRVRGGFSAGDFTTAGTGAVDADAQVSISGGVVVDEDLEHTVIDDPTPTNDFEQILSVAAELPVFYRSGGAGDWRKDTATAFPAKQGAARLKWNDPAGPWTTPDVSLDGNFVSMWLFATNSIVEPIIAILGQAEWTTLSDAQQNDTYETLLLGSLPAAEMKVLYRLIFETDSAFANTPNAALRDVRDLRTSIDTGLPAYSPADHGLMTGLQDRDHGTDAIFTGASGGPTPADGPFDGSLGPDDKTLALALATLDKYFKALQLRPHPSDPNRVVLTGSDVIKTNNTTLVQALGNFMVDFDGAEIDFSTGEVFESDGITPLGNDFVPATIAASQWRWYSVGLVPDTTTADNRITVKLQISVSDTDGASQNAAKRALFSGKTKVGQVAVQEAGGGIAAIDEGNIDQLGVGSGGGGDGGDPSFRVASVSGDIAKLNGGSIQVDDGTVLVSGAGTTEATVEVDIDIDLDAILGAPPANDTSYYLYVDRYTLEDPFLLTDSDRSVIRVNQANLKLLASPKSDVSAFRYIALAHFHSAAAGNVWVGAGASFKDMPRFAHDLVGAYVPNSEEFTHTFTTEIASLVVPHNLSDEPQILEIWYYDGSKKYGVNEGNYILDKGVANLELSSAGFVFGGGKYLEVKAFFIPRLANTVAGLSHQFRTGWFQDASVTSVLHGLSDMEDIKDYAIQEWDTTLDRRRNHDKALGLVKYFDDTTIELDWTGIAVAATLRFRLVAGGSPLPQSIPIQFGGFNKFVGFGPGSYATLAAAVAGAAPGDAILVGKALTSGAAVTITVSGILICFMPTCPMTFTAGLHGLIVNASDVHIIGAHLLFTQAGAATAGIELNGDDNHVSRSKVESNNAGLTLAAAVKVLAAADRSFYDVAVKRTLGAITTNLDDVGTDSAGNVRGS